MSPGKLEHFRRGIDAGYRVALLVQVGPDRPTRAATDVQNRRLWREGFEKLIEIFFLAKRGSVSVELSGDLVVGIQGRCV